MAKINGDTKVNVYNNVFNTVSVRLNSGIFKVLMTNGSKIELTVEDLFYVLSDAPALLTEGILYIKDEDVRKELDIEEFYKDGSIVESGKIEEILKQDAKEIKKTLKKASKTAKEEIAVKAKDKKGDLTLNQIEAIEEGTKKKIKD